jgi:membrane dipeptidase
MGFAIVDGHEDIATELLETGRDFASPAPPGHALSLPDLKRGDVAAVFATIFSPDGYWKGETGHENAERQLALYDRLLATFPEDLFRLESKGDVSLCRAGGPIGIVHLMEGADPVRHPTELARWVDRGVRFVGIAWNTPNRWAGGTRDDTGLTAEGFTLLAEMRRQKVVPDLSHLNLRACDDVLAGHDGLVIASHSNVHALRGHRRNLSDAQIREIGARGGVVGIVLYAPFIGEGEVTLDSVRRHIDHVAGLVGPDHVALGSDLDGGFRTDKAPRGIGSVADLPRIGEHLLGAGWPERDVAGVMGGNWMRILRQALPS